MERDTKTDNEKTYMGPLRFSPVDTILLYLNVLVGVLTLDSRSSFFLNLFFDEDGHRADLYCLGSQLETMKRIGES